MHYSKDIKDILAGSILIVIGGFATVYSLTTLQLGTFTRMGPGMFPTILGAVQLLFGFAILIPALMRRGEKLPSFDGRSLFFILASVFAFGVLVEPFGVVPAIFALTLISSRADNSLSLPGAIALAVALAVGSMLVFKVGLGMPVESFDWPF